mmetsp:Transcript_62884/g.167224  ORF Transcript_62884/g.167224 Transcript_62884/m.167224 type:complete len:247 (+) Transcript_62884:167-907(+)
MHGVCALPCGSVQWCAARRTHATRCAGLASSFLLNISPRVCRARSDRGRRGPWVEATRCASSSVLLEERGIGSRQLAAIGDHHLLAGLAPLAAHSLDRLDHVHALDHLAEDNVLAIEPRGLGGAQEELAAVGARARVRHREDARARVLEREVLVGKLGAVDRLAARAVAPGEVTALAHELRNHAVERRALEVQRLARLAHALLAGAERAEVLGRLRHDVGAQLHDDAARRRTADRHVEENLGLRHC